MKRVIFCAVGVLLTAVAARGQYTLTSETGPGSMVFEDFEGTTSATNGAFRGKGFSSSPASGMLDSDYWIAGGAGLFSLDCECLKEPFDMQYGDARSSFSSAAYIGNESPGNTDDGFGVYAFDTSNGGTKNVGLGLEPIFDIFNPGWFETRIRNNTGSLITGLTLSYDISVLNNSDLSNSWNFSWGTSSNGLAGGNLSALDSLDFASPTTADSSPMWSLVNKETSLTNLSLANGDYLHFRWTLTSLDTNTNEFSVFDEFALDNFSVENGDPTPTVVTVLAVSAEGGVNTIAWDTAPLGRGVNIFTSIDLATWTVLSTNNEDGVFTDSAPTVPRAFYAVVPIEVSFP